MDRFDRIFDLHKLLSVARRPVSRQRIEQELECSRATAKRIIEAMRLYLNAPIKYDREHNGYYYDTAEGGMYELPGVWFSASELHALLSVRQLLQELQPGLLEKQLAPLSERIEALLHLHQVDGDGLQGRIRILQPASRDPGENFQPVADALARRRRIDIDHLHRASGETSTRQVSPQRLVHYRNGWYLDAYCHLRAGLRTFALDAILEARPTAQPALEVTGQAMDEHFASAYGIFSGEADKTARLRFHPDIARWVAAEQWHPRQRGDWQTDGHYRLEIPYHNSTELVMDILKYGPAVEVLAPESLRQAVSNRLQQAAALYSAAKSAEDIRHTS